MNKFKLAVLAVLGLLGSGMALASDVAVSISVGQPGFYGQLDIGGYPPPQVIYREPRYVHRMPGVIVEPVYLRVPPGHARRWSRYCGRYDACGRPVYFVRDSWYDRVYVPTYRERYYGGRDYDDRRYERRDDRDHDGYEDRHEGRDEHWHDDDHDHDNGHGRGHDKHYH